MNREDRLKEIDALYSDVFNNEDTYIAAQKPTNSGDDLDEDQYTANFRASVSGMREKFNSVVTVMKSTK